MPTRSSLTRLVLSIVVCEAAGAEGSVFAIKAIPSWYAGLDKPWFSPPNWVFAPVWIFLYFLMGVSLYLLWDNRQRGNAALGAFAIQLALNALWSAVFFGTHQLFLAFAVIDALWVVIVATIVLSYRVSRGASIALLPYMAWVTIAWALNFYVWVLNA